MFLPRKLHDEVSALRVPGGAGAIHPLVVRESVLYRSTRSAEAEAPPRLAAWLLALGLAIAGVLAWVGLRGVGGMRWARVLASALYALWALVAGLLGVVLTILWTLTDHVFAHANEDLLLFNPLWLLLAVALPAYILAGRAAPLARALSIGMAFLALAALIAHAIMLSRQQNLAVIALALPPALVIAWVVTRPLPLDGPRPQPMDTSHGGRPDDLES
jgi:hypothetical protein